MQKVILPLLTSSLFFIESPTTNAMEDLNTTPKTIGSPTTRLHETPTSGDTALPNREQEELFQRNFYPDSPRQQLKLVTALDDSEWNPEAPLNDEYELLVAQYASRLQVVIDMDPGLRGSNRPPMILSSSLAPLEPPRDAPKVAPIAAVKVHDVAPEMPVYNEEAINKSGISNQMVLYCARVCATLHQQPNNSGLTVESLTNSLIQYSDANVKGWPQPLLNSIARHLLLADDLDSPEHHRANVSSGEPDKK